jgi:CheY-like chemotaxis protein
MAVKTALVVDDDAAIQQLVRDILEREGFHVRCEKDGEGAIAALESALPDLVVTDVCMPGLGGFEVGERLRRMPGGRRVPFVAMSGIYRGSRHRTRAREQIGALAYLDKPFSMAELVDVVRGAFASAPPASPAFRPEDEDAAARTSMADEGPLQGSFADTPFPEVLAALHRRRADGALYVRREKTKKIVYVRAGTPFAVKSNVLGECLGQVLVRERMIRAEECARSVLRLKEGGKGGRKQGEILVEMGAISPQNLVYGLQLQLEHKLFDLFAWRDGAFLLQPDVEAPPPTVQLDLPWPRLVHEGVRNKLDDAVLEERLAPGLPRFVALRMGAGEALEALALDPDERRLLALVDGRRRLEELIAVSDRTPSMQLLYTLLVLEACELQERPVAAVAVGGTSSRPPPLRPRGEARADDVGADLGARRGQERQS